MYVYCSWHPKYFGKKLFMGQKAPLWDKCETNTICQDCMNVAIKTHIERKENEKKKNSK